MTEDRGKMLYCSCDAFIGRTGTPPDCGKTVEIVPRGCDKCKVESEIAKHMCQSLDALHGWSEHD